ncbi:TetR/AcrR family transcriptional regulator [[Mycobacterium] nativiensis]|uniref:TetR/AcrR family transcriptional regulator n=1 Tax=[Mycobacterium] nativiensis TaxID=2855503 RepID=A0ABU5XX22_9MYCO|nr:TetR/AcrR family transcriptional regulator [Mycolicibacter sp. MYC340]MEB3031265.1 TetR/AcrR family transcriptional regulator [Mycolicibacter sp. MYC340]
MVITLGATNDPASSSGARIKRRPKDRKAQITRAAAETFSAQGYTAASMEAIAAKVGISAPALYRHYPNKYEMFSVVVSMLGDHLMESTAFIDDVSDAEMATDAQAVLDRAVDALITSAIRDRDASGLYRWQNRYLQPDDQAALMVQMRKVNRRLQRPLMAMRPGLTVSQRWSLSVSLLSVAGSVIGHRLEFPDSEIRPLLLTAARAVAATELPESGDGLEVSRPAVWRIFTPSAGPYEALLHAAVLLFGQKGYAETSVTEIAEAVGVPASGVYRYFSSKSDILTTGLQRAMDRFAGEMSAIASVFVEPAQTLPRLIEAYVATVFANPELTAVHDNERVNLAPAERELLRDSERVFTDTWAKPLVEIRPELTFLQAKFLVHAVTALVADLGRLAREDQPPGGVSVFGDPVYAQACLRKLMEAVLLGTD